MVNRRSDNINIYSGNYSARLPRGHLQPLAEVTTFFRSHRGRGAAMRALPGWALLMLSGAAAYSELIERISHLDKPAQFKKSIDLNIDMMGCWTVEVVSGASYFTNQMYLSPTALRHDELGTPYFHVDMSGIPGLASYRLEIHEEAGLVSFETVWTADATASQKLRYFSL